MSESLDPRLLRGLRAMLDVVGGHDTPETRAAVAEVRQSVAFDEHVAGLRAAGRDAEADKCLETQVALDERKKGREHSAGRKAEAEALRKRLAELEG